MADSDLSPASYSKHGEDRALLQCSMIFMLLISLADSENAAKEMVMQAKISVATYYSFSYAVFVYSAILRELQNMCRNF